MLIYPQKNEGQGDSTKKANKPSKMQQGKNI
jgi:hypothetical protein